MRYCRLQNREGSVNSDAVNDRAYSCWKKWMDFGSRTGCHQRADRSFFLKGYQLPVCARCTGVLLGYLAAIPCFFLFGFSKAVSFVGAAALFTDWFLQFKGVKESTNRRRLITGICGGFSLMSIQLFILMKIIKVLSRKHKS